MNKKQLPTGVRVLLGFVSVLLCIVLFACTLVTILVADVSLVTSKGGIQKLIKDVLFSTSAPYRAPVYSPCAAAPGKNTVRLDDFNLDMGAQDALIDTIYGMLEDQFEGELSVSKEQVQEFVDKSTLPDFISDKVSGIVSDVIMGESTTTITKEDVVGLLEDNKELIEETFKTEIPQEVIDEVGTWIEENDIMDTVQKEVENFVGAEIAPPAAPETPDGDASASGKPSSGASSNVSAGLELMDSITKGEVDEFGIAEVLVMVRFITAPTVLYICIAACLLLVALLFLTNWGKPNAALVCGGIPILLAGGLLTAPIAIIQTAPDLFPFAESDRIAVNIVQQVMSLAGTINIGVTVFGLALIIVGAVLGSVLKKKRIAAAAAAATVTTDAAALSDALLAEEENTEAADVSAIDDGSDFVEALLGAEAPAEAAAEEAAEETEV